MIWLLFYRSIVWNIVWNILLCLVAVKVYGLPAYLVLVETPETFSSDSLEKTIVTNLPWFYIEIHRLGRPLNLEDYLLYRYLGRMHTRIKLNPYNNISKSIYIDSRSCIEAVQLKENFVYYYRNIEPEPERKGILWLAGGSSDQYRMLLQVMHEVAGRPSELSRFYPVQYLKAGRFVLPLANRNKAYRFQGKRRMVRASPYSEASVALPVAIETESSGILSSLFKMLSCSWTEQDYGPELSLIDNENSYITDWHHTLLSDCEDVHETHLILDGAFMEDPHFGCNKFVKELVPLDNDLQGGGGETYTYSSSGGKAKFFVKRISTQDKIRLMASRKELLTQINISHPMFVRHFGAFQYQKKTSSPLYFYQVMEFFSGKDLERYIKQPVNDIVGNEATGVMVIRAIGQGVVWLHQHGIAHRDLKTKNVMVKEPLNQMENIKIVDLGMACSTLDQSRKSYGTINYKAPELIKRNGIRRKKYKADIADVWSYTSIALATQLGQEPNITSGGKVVHRTADDKFFFHQVDKVSSKEARKFILRGAIINPDERPPLSKLLDDPWLSAGKAAAGLNKGIP